MSVLRSSAAVYAKSDKNCGHEFFALIVKPTFAPVPVHLGNPGQLLAIGASAILPSFERNFAKLRFLRMSPNRYVRLQRLDMVRGAQRRAYSPIATVLELAGRYGFSELGRFPANLSNCSARPPFDDVALCASRSCETRLPNMHRLLNVPSATFKTIISGYQKVVGQVRLVQRGSACLRSSSPRNMVI